MSATVAISDAAWAYVAVIVLAAGCWFGVTKGGPRIKS